MNYLNDPHVTLTDPDTTIDSDSETPTKLNTNLNDFTPTPLQTPLYPMLLIITQTDLTVYNNNECPRKNNNREH